MNLESPARPAGALRSPAHSSFNAVFKWFLVAFGGVSAMLIASLLLLLFGVESGIAGLLVGIFCATLPVPIYAAFLLWIDRFEPEPPWMLAVAFLWGALVSALVAYVLNSLFKEVFGTAASVVLSAPFVEESMKATILVVFFLFRKADFDGVIDGVVYAGLVALGFAMTENIAYYSREFHPEGHLGAVLILRGVMSPFAHPLFTSMTGIGLGIARESKNVFAQLIAPALGFMMAIFLHFIWNAGPTLGGGGGLLVMYFFIMVPTFFVVMGVVLFALIQEGRMVQRNLSPELHAGLLTSMEIQSLSRMFGRMAALLNALMNRGFGGWLARQRLHEAASRLAFHRHRIACGTIEQNDESAALEHDLQTRLIHASRRTK